MPTLEIARLSHLEQTEFYSDYYGVAPVLLPAFVRDSRACRKWSPEYLDSVVGDKIVQVHYWPRSLGRPTGEAVREMTRHFDAPFSRASELIRGSSEFVYFLIAKPVRETFPELLGDLDFDELILRAPQLTSINLWHAPAGHLTLLHFDGYDNFLNQIVGRKKVTLFSPSDQKYLYSTEDGKRTRTVNLSEPEEDQFPEFRRATPFEFTLEPGDTLYLPRGWSHQIESLDHTISVTFFFGTRESHRG